MAVKTGVLIKDLLIMCVKKKIAQIKDAAIQNAFYKRFEIMAQ